MNKKQIRLVLLSILLIVVSCIVLLPVFRKGFLITDDGDWMVIRLSAFYQSFREGQFPVRFLGRLNQSYGYPVANFLYPGFMYIGSILHFLGLSFQASVEAIIVGASCIGTLFTFFWLKRIFSEKAGLVGAITYLLMPYFLFDIFKRGSVGEILVIGLTPVALYAIETKSAWLLTPIIALIAISHNTLAAFFVPLLLGYIALKKYWNLILYFIFGVGMTSFFWLPALFERSIVTFDVTAISNPGSYFLISHELLLSSIPIIIAALFLFFNSTYKKQKEFWFFVIILGVSTFFATKGSAFLWRISTFVKFVQFPFRWLSFFTIAGPWLVACSAFYLKKGKQYIVMAFGVLLFVGVWAYFYLPAESRLQPEGYFTTNEATTTVKDEYMPRWASKRMSSRSAKRVEFFTGNGTIEEKNVTTQQIDILIHANEESVIQINSIYYPGWGAMLDNEKAIILYENDYGLMRIQVPAGDHHLFMEFRETGGRFLADVLSVSFAAFYCFFLIGQAFVPKKKKREIEKKVKQSK